MRATVDGLATPHPLGHLLPGLYHDDDLAQRFTGALDVVLAPVLATLDSSDAYVDPLLAPLDFVEWLAEWVGVELDASWPEERQRTLVARAAELYSWRGTVRGVREAVAIYTGVEPEISETGGTAWTGTPPPTGALPGSPSGLLLVRVRVAPDEPIDAGRLDRLVAAAKPAHIAHRVEIVEDARLRPRALPPEPPPPPPVPDDVPTDLDGGWPGDGDDDGITVTSARGIPPAVVPGTGDDTGGTPGDSGTTDSESTRDSGTTGDSGDEGSPGPPAPPVLPAGSEWDEPEAHPTPPSPPAPPRRSAPPPAPPAPGPPARPAPGPPPPPRPTGDPGSPRPPGGGGRPAGSDDDRPRGDPGGGPGSGQG